MRRILIWTGLAALGAFVASRLPLAAARDRLRRIARRDLKSLSRDELYRKAQESDIPGRSEMNKDELIEALEKES
jgi:hypothetical protein